MTTYMYPLNAEYVTWGSNDHDDTPSGALQALASKVDELWCTEGLAPLSVSLVQSYEDGKPIWQAFMTIEPSINYADEE